ncbi:hypothetical protein BE04_11125 [Sorangium cellulosum]|uniref:Uncharacterized protein n=2 Tax=Sorangium cellulosum TaxID=56 RepID=A0A150QN93_SORCE|nr:hypothetical protein SCE1572_15810 [Sorangium cellulosum So0157-2]KYF69463.1 hypothetical protein BE04_11125 [Sorangium cellulosum]
MQYRPIDGAPGRASLRGVRVALRSSPSGVHLGLTMVLEQPARRGQDARLLSRVKAHARWPRRSRWRRGAVPASRCGIAVSCGVARWSVTVGKAT